MVKFWDDVVAGNGVFSPAEQAVMGDYFGGFETKGPARRALIETCQEKAWREKNKEYFRRKNKEYYENNKEYIQIKNALYRMNRGCQIGPVIMEKLLKGDESG